MSTCCIALGEPAQIRGSISKMNGYSEEEVDSEPGQIRGSISKMRRSGQLYDKICVNRSFCAYMRMYRETEKLIET